MTGLSECIATRGLTFGDGDVLALADTSSLAPQLAQVVQLGPADMATGDYLDLLDNRGVDREDPLNADVVGNLADRE